MSAPPPTAMTRAAVIDAFGGPDVLSLRALELPALEPGQVLVRTLAAAVNPIDAGTRAGRVPTIDDARLPLVLGWDLAGEVVRVGAGVRGWRPGDRAIALIWQPRAPMGAYAEHVVLDATLLAPWPGSAPEAVAAALPLAGLTARSALDALDLRRGHVLLINGILGSIGSLACQLAARAGVLVAGVARASRFSDARTLGARWTLDRDGDGLAAQAARAIDRPVDAALDVVGGATAHATLAAVRDGGRYATTLPPWWAPGGPFAPERGIVPNVIERKDPAQLPDLSRLLAAGRLRIDVARTLPLADAAEAHRLLEDRPRAGKLVLVPDPAT